ncbi:MAG: pyridoxal-phosphate dependent enzyme [Xanthomonadales bacterium]|nr:pyridoxal-phosphate dependent enzyme [Xanthomonadales bacterium]
MNPAIHASILETIGHTPVVRINSLAPDHVSLFAKVEAFNPMGSVKDRMALSTIEAAAESGALKPGQTVIEATSGNTGIGLAMVCAVKGHPLVLTMAESFSIERRRILRFLGAKVVLTPAEDKGSGMLAKAEELAARHDWFLVRQFENEANADAHTRTTAVEILEAFGALPLHYFVTGFGTGGTLKGTSRVLRERSPDTQIIVCEPDNSQILGSGIPQDRRPDGAPAASHPNFRPHLMQGWSPDFIPKLTEDAVNAGVIDRIVPVDGNEALRLARELARREGIFCGTSGGATFAGALAVARDAEPGSNILCMLPDTGERYLSTPLFEGIPSEMTEEELEISRSTPSHRFDRKPAATPAQPAQQVAVDAEAAKFVENAINDAEHPVAFFALEWCEFCWSVRKLFARLEIPYQAFDLDSVAYQQDNRGGKIRAVLLDRLGTPTIPQIFIAGRHIGGATDLFTAYKDGRLERLLSRHGIELRETEADFEPESLLPGWLHKR